jgi:hypothetical protein
MKEEEGTTAAAVDQVGQKPKEMEEEDSQNWKKPNK